MAAGFLAYFANVALTLLSRAPADGAGRNLLSIPHERNVQYGLAAFGADPHLQHRVFPFVDLAARR